MTPIDVASPQREADPALGPGTDLGRQQLEHLDLMLDQHSIKALTATGIRPGLRCLEIGAGSGSMARWMASRVQPEGSVVALDVETSQLDGGLANVDVRRYDINHGVPGGPYDLIHARLVLMHLPRRRQLVNELINALTPGGWLVLGEYLGPSLGAVEGPTVADCELFERVVGATVEKVCRPGGTDYGWALDVDEVMGQAGLVHLHSERNMATTTGGTTGCLLYQNYVRQATPYLLDVDIEQDEIDRFDRLMGDPRFRAWFFEFTSVRGQRPFA
ncbi:class I SAM-dependent methyltransferase [Ornithinimicrobium faecis]|uniref:Class I SAM-dependent methyltransferase n=1 Tax=Ornithinimicrobium faecis TaxID=2934158 RepID=A0ABY4YY19_9MICO|nr:class I SAM-dependent methyltransferase [Ornithinimicrobium sp. HY1793]USQ81243.1 class I SAM-dependent methyltransferase [Ornithinimicrobium sp. HY1793]